ncbi:hypothetical protein DFJ63DRAFT_218968 [Scheffersomyces coipomensis]|uniref:uncharacterized protein n=1 Tax=Scheffersomyces coipomensis TaxID=1788519 RepID=UPI00315D7E0C
MSKSKSDLLNLVSSFDEATSFWRESFTASDNAVSKIQSAKVDKPLQEFTKLIKLIKAHTTKVGIIFKPENIKKDVNPAYKTLKDLSETLVLLVSIIAQLQAKVISQLFYDEILLQIKQLLDSNSGFGKELKLIVEDESAEEKETKKDEIDGRLVSVGKIWTICDSLIQLIQDGKFGLLTSKIKLSIDLIEDGYEEFEEWAKNPTEFDEEDPFGFSDDESIEEDEEDGANPPTTEAEDESEPDASKEELKAFAQKWSKNIDLVKLLIASFKKSLPATTEGEIVDQVYKLQNNLVSLIDKLIVDLMLDQTIDDDVKEYTNSITKESRSLAKIGIDVHQTNAKKSKWYEAWITKFNTDL